MYVNIYTLNRISIFTKRCCYLEVGNEIYFGYSEHSKYILHCRLYLPPSVPIRNYPQIIQGDSKLLSGFPWPINGNPDNNLELPCTKKLRDCKARPL
jgi:hypothetical protein